MNDCGVLVMIDESEKSIVVWWPNLRLGVPGNAEWASLCLWHDRVVYIGQHFVAEDGLTIVNEKPTNIAEAAFYNVISELSGEMVVVHIQMPEGMKMDSGPGYMPPVVLEAFLSIFASQHERWPLVSNEPGFQWQHLSSTRTKQPSELLAITAISQLSLPHIRPAHVHDLLEARTALRDELLEFRAAILNMTWLLHQQVKGKNDLDEIRQEADMLVNTMIKAAVMSLEHRIQQHENKRIRRMLFGTGRVLVDAATVFLPGGLQEKLAAGGKALLQTATEICSAKPPEDQIATYLYKLKRYLKC
jgi:hypothetical protein